MFPLSIRAACSSCAKGWPVAVIQEYFEASFLVQSAGFDVEYDDARFYARCIQSVIFVSLEQFASLTMPQQFLSFHLNALDDRPSVT